MPELPEVETIARGLRATLPGKKILAVHLGKTDFIDDPVALERDLPGHRIEEVMRYGKFLILRLSASNGSPHSSGLLVHLGMTGHLSPKRPDEPQLKHTHAVFALDDGRELRYTDPRRFGRMAFLSPDALRKTLAPLGADPLEIPAPEFVRLITSRNSRIKALLLDQHVLRGLGNIYADESLWRARIHPAQIGARFAHGEALRLCRAVQHVLREAIRLRGSSISDYLDTEGEPGAYQLRHRAYGREGKRCYRCSAKIRRVIVAGRSSYFCPQCQKAPRGFRPASAAPRAKKKAT